MSKKKDTEEQAIVEPFTQFEIGELVIPVVETLDDLPFKTIVTLNKLGLRFGSGEFDPSDGKFIDGVIEYVSTYASAVSKPIDWDALEKPGKAFKDVLTVFSRLFTHLNKSEAGEDPVEDVEAGKNA